MFRVYTCTIRFGDVCNLQPVIINLSEISHGDKSSLYSLPSIVFVLIANIVKAH